MSKFFNRVSSSDDSVASSSDDKDVQIQSKNNQLTKKFVFTTDDLSSDEDKRVIRSEQEKKNQIMKTHNFNIKEIVSSLNFDKLLSEFDLIVKNVQKYNINQNQKCVAYKILIKILSSIEENTEITWNDSEKKKTLNKGALKSLNTLRQKVKKFNVEYINDITEFKKSPEIFEQNVELDEVSSKSIEEKDSKNDSSSDNAIFDDSDSDSGSSSSFDLSTLNTNAPSTHLRSIFLKNSSIKKEGKRERKDPKVAKKKASVEEKAATSEVHKVKLFTDEINITAETLCNKAKDILKIKDKRSMYGEFRRNIIYLINLSLRMDQYQVLQGALMLEFILRSMDELTDASNYYMVPKENFSRTTFKLGPNDYDTGDDVYSVKTKQSRDLLEIWVESIGYFLHLLKVVETSENKIIFNSHREDETLFFEFNVKELQSNETLSLACDVFRVIEIIFETFFLILNYSDNDIHGDNDEFTFVLNKDQLLINLIDSSIPYFEKHLPQKLINLYLLKMDLIYYKASPQISFKLLNQIIGASNIENIDLDYSISTDLINIWEKVRTLTDKNVDMIKAELYVIYNLCINNDWEAANKMYSESKLYDEMYTMDISLQMFYNRTMSQMAICAFSCNDFDKAFQILSSLFESKNPMRLLGQKPKYFLYQQIYNKIPTVEVLSPKNKISQHLQINMNLLESIMIVSGIMINSPLDNCYLIQKLTVAGNIPFLWKSTLKSHQVSLLKAYYYLYTRGDWEECLKSIYQIKEWNSLVDFEGKQKIIRQTLQERALTIFLHMHTEIYSTLKINDLAEKFQMDEKELVTRIKKLILNANVGGYLNNEDTIFFVEDLIIGEEPFKHLKTVLKNFTEFFEQLRNLQVINY